MAVTIFPSNAEARAYDHNDLPSAAFSLQDIFKQSCPNEFFSHPNASVLFSGTSAPLSSGHVYPTSDGFVRGVIDAWAQHQHLVLRPEEVWFSVLAQINFYMGNNAEALRGLFVSHAGKEEIVVGGDTMEEILELVGKAIQGRVKTNWLLDWISPNFTTSTANDVLTANVLMMGLMKQYFDYGFYITCGLPSVTLLGEKADWELLLAKLEHMAKFGKEPKQYAKQLQPILKRFVQTFDTPDDPEVRRFWNSILYAEQDEGLCGAPPYYLSGWLMGFFFWDQEGEPLSNRPGALSLDGVKYAYRGIDSLPVGYAQAPVKIFKFQGQEKFPAYLLSGNVGKHIAKGLPDGYADALKRFNGTSVDESLPHGTLQPVSGWLIYGPAPPADSGEGSYANAFEMSDLCRSLDRSHAADGITPTHAGSQAIIEIGETVQIEL